MQRQATRHQIIELGFHSNGWMTLFIPKRTGTTSLSHDEFVANISGLKEFFGINSGPNAPRIHNRVRKFWAIPPEFVRKFSDDTIQRAIRDIWSRCGVETTIDVFHHDYPFTETGDLT